MRKRRTIGMRQAWFTGIGPAGNQLLFPHNPRRCGLVLSGNGNQGAVSLNGTAPHTGANTIGLFVGNSRNAVVIPPELQLGLSTADVRAEGYTLAADFACTELFYEYEDYQVHTKRRIAIRQAFKAAIPVGAGVLVLPQNRRRCGLIISGNTAQGLVTLNGNAVATTSPNGGAIFVGASRAAVVLGPELVEGYATGDILAAGIGGAVDIAITEFFYEDDEPPDEVQY